MNKTSEKSKPSILQVIELKFLVTTQSSLLDTLWRKRYSLESPLYFEYKTWLKVVDIRKAGRPLLPKVAFKLP